MSRKFSPPPILVFDFGGVLLDWNPRYLYRQFFPGNPEAMEEFLEEIGFTTWNLEQDKGRPFALAVEELSRQFPHYAALIKAYDERWEESLGGPIQPVVDILFSLKQAGCEMHGLSNWSQEKFEIARPQYAFFDWFKSIMVSGAVRLVKPDPRIFQIFLERIGHPAAACLFIDDSIANVTAASQLGFQTIHFQSADQLQSELFSRGILPGNNCQI